MWANQRIASLLDETIAALSNFDSVKLRSLEEQMSSLAKSNVEIDLADVSVIQQKKLLLGIVLRNCDANLNALERLHARNEREQWVR